MPNGRVHAMATAIVGIGALGAVVLLREQYGFGLDMWAFPAGALSGLLLSPDLDVDGGNHSDFIVRSRVGPIAQFCWRCFWFPYAKFVPHRSSLSHFPVLGTFLRVLYIFVWLFFWALMLEAFWGIGAGDGLLAVFVQPWFPWWFLGLALADLWHAVLDVLF